MRATCPTVSETGLVRRENQDVFFAVRKNPTSGNARAPWSTIAVE